MSKRRIYSNGDLYSSLSMISSEGNYQQNDDGSWSTAIPLPLYGLKKRCNCGKSFWRESNYEKHYIAQHTNGKKYIRTSRGMEQL